MPELPEVQTTVDGLSSRIIGLTITDVWTDYNSAFHTGKDSIKDPAFFAIFKKKIIGASVTRITRHAKNILIHLSTGDTVLIHMKMTGHILFGRYVFDKKSEAVEKDVWSPAPDERVAFHDPFNRFIHFVIIFSTNGFVGKDPVLVLSDMRKFAKVTLVPASEISKNEDAHTSAHLASIGPDALDPTLTFALFKERLYTRPNGKIKTVLMDQSVLAGVGNIYSDEALWRTGLHPEELVKNIPDPRIKKLLVDTKKVLSKGIDFGGDSMSDYRNIDGERGRYQERHQAYRKTGSPCTFKGTRGEKICTGTILRKVVGGRSAHFCSVHQRLINKP
ncbi:MAG: DNA-formamidopyrimidine glycosylase family protein [bacterium]